MDWAATAPERPRAKVRRRERRARTEAVARPNPGLRPREGFRDLFIDRTSFLVAIMGRDSITDFLLFHVFPDRACHPGVIPAEPHQCHRPEDRLGTSHVQIGGIRQQRPNGASRPRPAGGWGWRNPAGSWGFCPARAESIRRIPRGEDRGLESVGRQLTWQRVSAALSDRVDAAPRRP